jgi:hypothetical protein
MGVGLGRFGDRRLEKGGTFCWLGWSRLARLAFGFARSEAAELGRCGSPAFCATSE